MPACAGMTRKLLAGLVGIFIFATAAQAAEALILTDIHFNPFADKSLAEALVAAPAEQWPAILDRGQERMSIYGEDTDWKLLQSALTVIAAQPKPDFVLAPGDFLAHEFRTRFNASVAQHDDAAYTRFTVKTMRFLALAIEAATSHAPIMPALGNNDSDCGDYGVAPGGSFLAGTEATVAGMIGSAAGDDFATSWTALGNYMAPIAALPDTSVIALNDNFFSPHYRDTCGAAARAGNPARATLAWLERALADAAAAHRKVILIYHIPPGTDAFATAKQNVCPVTPVPLLAEPYATDLHALMRRYRDTIAAEIAGHLHTAAFRIRRDQGKAFGFVMIAPAVSPIFAQDPSFTRLAIGPGDTIRDATTYYLANLPAAGAGQAPAWQAEASFDRAWDASGFNTASLEKLFRDIGSSPEARQRWIARYGVQGPAGGAITPESAASYRCSVGTDEAADFARCLCGAGAR
ncbi:MAG TPA: metallophosphoesterase [Stellaceae bacterium]|nr:metallophosphoesterase [Stellaceae bacterium]